MEKAIEIIWYPLVLPIVMVLLSGALAYLFARFSALAAKTAALAGCIIVIVLTIGVLRDYPGITFFQPWVRLTPNVTISLNLAATTLGMVVVLGSAGFALLVGVYSLDAMAGTRWEGKFYAYLTWALAGACIVGLAGDLLMLLIGWELVTLMLFLMINLGRGEARAGAAKAYGVLGFADACLLMAIVLLAAQPGGSGNLSLSRAQVTVSSMGATGYVVYVLILIAAMAKAGAIPLHSWIPGAAKDAPTPVMALLPAALDKLLGIYLLAVLTLRMFTPDWTMQVVLMLVGGVTIIAAVLMAMMQHNVKRLLSFHAVSQVGYMVLGIGTGTTIGILGGLFHMINNAIYKCNLFLMSGTVGRAAGSDEIEDMGGAARLLPVTFICACISAAAISGVPPFNGFVSKWMVYQGTLGVRARGLATAMVVVAVFGSALTLASFVKVIYSAFLSPAPARAGHVRRPPRESLALAAPMVLLAAACVVLGLWPGLVVERVLVPAVNETTVHTGEIVDGAAATGLWQPGPATGLLLIGIAGGLVFLALSTHGRKARVVRPFLGGEVPLPAGEGGRGARNAAGDSEQFRMPGTHFYETIGKLPLIGGLLTHGQAGAMDVYHWSGKHGHTFVELLRRLHAGLINLYVAWAVVGLTVILVYLLLTVGI